MHIPTIPYLPLPSEASTIPLQRFIPPYSKGLISEWLDVKVPKGLWLIDPLAANPLLDIEVAQKGYKILTARSNPVILLMLEVLSSAPTADQFQSALSQLFTSNSELENLQDHLQSLYLTQCKNCDNPVMVDGFIWERGHDRPKSRLYTCHKCGQEGEQEISQFDLDKLNVIEQQARKHRSRARQRIEVGMQIGYYGLEEALDCYQARSLTFLMTLINKLEGSAFPKAQEQLVMALILSLMDYGNTLWPWPLKPYRPLTLTTPALYFEHNLWLALQTAIKTWVAASAPAIVTRWPEIKEDAGGICLYQRSKVELEAIRLLAKPQAILTIFPHPNQAFLTFSALWSGWLWGTEAVQSVHGALDRRRYDWRWLAGTLQQILQPIQNDLPLKAPFFGLAPDPTPANLYAIISSARSCQFTLQGIAYRQDDHLFQLEWRNTQEKENNYSKPPSLQYRETIKEAIQERGEPLTYAEIQYLCLCAHALANKLPDHLQGQEEDELNPTLVEIKKIIQDLSFLKPIKAPHSTQSSQWWLAQTQAVQPPLPEQVEVKILEILREKKIINLQELDRQICIQFPGFLTPSLELIKAILDSYTEPILEIPGSYRLFLEDEKNFYLKDKNQFKTELTEIGKGFGYQVAGNNPLHWIDEKQQPVSIFYFLETSKFSSLLNEPTTTPPEGHFLVFPASRSQLILFRLRRDLHLKEEIESGWHFLKLRHLHQLAHQKDLTIAIWKELVQNDPPLWNPPDQLSMF